MQIHINNDIFPSNLIWLRKQYALSQTALARLTGQSPAIIRGIERGRFVACFDVQVLQRMCEIFQVTPEDITRRPLDPEKKDPEDPGTVFYTQL